MNDGMYYHGDRRTAEDTSNKKIIEGLIGVSGMSKEDARLILEKIPGDPTAVKAFQSFSIKAKLLFSVDLAAVAQEKAKIQRERQEWREARHAKYKAIHDQVDRLYEMIRNNPKLTSKDIPTDLQDIFKSCRRQGNIGKVWFKYLRVNSSAYPRTEFDYDYY